MTQKYPSDEQERFMVRFPIKGMRKRISNLAKTNRRSMNAEIVARLQQSFEASNNDLSQASVGDLINELLSRFPPELIYIRIGEKHEEDK